jgi:[histone H3]-lysine9 N-trimethyltransferase SUV39H
MGGPTRFINHSCDPNLLVFAGEELSFDYQDKDGDEHDFDEEEEEEAIECLCGAPNCRGQFW